MPSYEDIFRRIQAHPRYQRNLDKGEPRPGHPEGTIRAHIGELEQNLQALRDRLSDEEYCKLRILIHTHDTFKPETVEGLPIRDSNSHASLARAFLAQLTDDADLLAIAQSHDEPYAMWRQLRQRGQFNRQRFERLLQQIRDWELFLAFALIDGSTRGKTCQPLRWLFEQSSAFGRASSRFSADDCERLAHAGGDGDP